MSWRETKKRQFRELIRANAIRLFTAKGYRDTTMEQIAAASGVAPRTVYRYFPTKDTLVITDEDDERMLAQFRAELSHHSPIEALRRSFGPLLLGSATQADRQRQALIASEPELQAAMLRQIIGLADRYAAAMVELGKADGDPDAALALAGAFAGIALVHTRWDGQLTIAEQMQKIDAALDQLARGFAPHGA